MEDVDKILLNMIGTKASQNQYNLFKMKACWSEIAGKNNANHCIPVKLDRRILTLKVDSSVWANQFLYYKIQFIEKINRFMGVDYVKDIKFIVGSNIKIHIKKINKNIKTHKDKIDLPPLNDNEKKAIKIKFSHIQNDKIRNAVINAEEKRYGLEKLFNEGKIKKCPLCGSYIKDKRNICFECERKKQENKETEIWKLIIKEPWIGWNEANKVVKCDEFEFDIVKNDVKAYYFEKIRNKTADAKEEMIAIQLKSGKPYALIGEKEKVNILRFLQKGKL